MVSLRPRHAEVRPTTVVSDLRSRYDGRRICWKLKVRKPKNDLPQKDLCCPSFWTDLDSNDSLSHAEVFQEVPHEGQVADCTIRSFKIWSQPCLYVHCLPFLCHSQPPADLASLATSSTSSAETMSTSWPIPPSRKVEHRRLPEAVTRAPPDRIALLSLSWTHWHRLQREPQCPGQRPLEGRVRS